MATVSVVYHAGMGHAQKMAQAVAKGAGGINGVQVNLIAIEGKDIANGLWSERRHSPPTRRIRA